MEEIFRSPQADKIQCMMLHLLGDDHVRRNDLLHATTVALGGYLLSPLIELRTDWMDEKSCDWQRRFGDLTWRRSGDPPVADLTCEDLQRLSGGGMVVERSPASDQQRREHPNRRPTATKNCKKPKYQFGNKRKLGFLS